MADAIVSALVQSVFQNLGSVALQQIGAAWGLKDELDKLGSLFGTIQAVLEEAEVKRRNNKPLQIWLLKLKDAAYDADDILDQVATQGLNRGVNSERGKIHELSAFFSKCNRWLFKSRIVVKVKEITARLDAIANEKHNFHLMEDMTINNRTSDTLQDRQTSSLVNESEIYGRNEERDIIVEKLVGGGICDQEDLAVFAVCGMGGIGKTTLAQLVYNDKRVVEGHFDVRIWVCVSDDFSIQRLIRVIIESIGDKCDSSELDPLQRHLQGKLRGRRYLLILDDVWNENPNPWDRLKETLRCGSKGSVVMVTTRSEKVATMMAAINIHRLQYLSEEHSWLLFKRRAFANGEGGGKEFEEIGKEIVTKCGGVPLAVKAVGSLMRYKSSQSEWLAIQKSAIWPLSGDENDILPVLRLSYDNLPLQMRQCFSYCCIFPKDYKMHADLLVQLWMANGFVSSDNEAGSYLTGCSIFKELVWRSFFQDVEKDYEGIMYCKMHDLMHDLAKSVMIHETHVLEHGKEIKIPKTVRHLSFENISDGLPLYRNKGKLKWRNGKSLRSLIVHTDAYSSTDGFSLFSFFLSRQQNLRVLRTRTYDSLANIVCKLEQLRYLEMPCRHLKTLPESLIRLQNLQTLKLLDTWSLVELPKGLKYLKNLCFVTMSSSSSLVCTPPELRELTCLQELSIFIVGEHGVHKIDQLKDLNLGGGLSIRGLEYIENYDDAKSANLQTKINLTCLNLDWRNEIRQRHAEHYEDVLEGLQPNQNLEKIDIQGYQGSKFPKWMSTSYFKNLSRIALVNCSKCERLPALGKLPSLKHLFLNEMHAIKRLDVEWHGDGDSSFPALTILRVIGMDNLVEWTTPDSVESFPSLTWLDIFGCPKLIGLPFLPNLKKLSLSSGKNTTLLRSIMGLTSVTELRLYAISGLDVLPEGLFQKHSALKSLGILQSFIKTLSNELDNLSALQSLELGSCHNLEDLPERLKHLISVDQTHTIWPSLTHLTIRYCSKLKKLQPLPSTSSLQVYWYP